MRKSVLVREFICLVGAIGLTVVYQNCAFSTSGSVVSQANLAASASPSSLAYAHIRQSGVCDDGSLIDSSLLLEAGVGIITRDNCANVAVADQRQVAVVTDPTNPSYVTYNGMTYVNSFTSFARTEVTSTKQIYSVGKYRPGMSTVQYPFISKTDSGGALIWAKSLPLDHTSNLVALKSAPSGDLILVGSMQMAGGHYGLVAAVHANGEVYWAKAYGTALPASQAPFFEALDIDSSGNIYIAGEIRHLTDAGAESIAVKLDPSGLPLWQRSYSGMDVWFNQVRLNSAGSLFLAGRFSVPGGAGQAGLLKMTTDGALTWSKLLDGAVYALAPTADGGVAVGGGLTAGQSFVAKYAASGVLVFSSQISTPEQSLGHFSGLSERPDGSLLASGVALRGNEGLVGALTSLTSAGAAAWSIEYKNTGFDSFDGGHKWLADQSLWIGLTTSTANGETSGALLHLSDSAAQGNCPACVLRGDVQTSAAPLNETQGPSLNTNALVSFAVTTLPLLDLKVKLDVR